MENEQLAGFPPNEQPSSRTWLVYRLGFNKTASKRKVKLCRSRKRIGKEAQLFGSANAKTQGTVYSALVPAVMGTLLPITIAALIVMFLLFGFVTSSLVSGDIDVSSFSSMFDSSANPDSAAVDAGDAAASSDSAVADAADDAASSDSAAVDSSDATLPSEAIFSEMQDWLSNLELSDLPGSFFALVAALYLLSFAIGIPLIVLCLHKIEKRKFATIGIRGKKRGLHFLCGMLIGIVVLLIPAFLSTIISGQTFRLNPNITSADVLRPLLLAFLFFAVQGSYEELVFRGWSFTALGRCRGRAFSLLLSSLVFGSMHFSGLSSASWFSVANAFLLGCLLCMLTLWTGDIFLSCGLHAMWNLLQTMLVEGFTKAGGLLDPSLKEALSGNTYLLLMEGMVVLLFAVLAILYSRKVKREDGMVLEPLPPAVFA